MLVIRLFRTGKKNQPFFKIVVTDKRKPPRGGEFVEQVGSYNPIKKEKTLKKERIAYWLKAGAQPSATVYNMLVSEKIIEDKKIPKHKKSKKPIETAAAVPAASAAPAAGTEAPATAPIPVAAAPEAVKLAEGASKETIDKSAEKD